MLLAAHTTGSGSLRRLISSETLATQLAVNPGHELEHRAEDAIDDDAVVVSLVRLDQEPAL